MRVVFFGTPQFAVPSLATLLRSGHDVAAVVTQPDRPRGRGHHVEPSPVKRLAIQHGLIVWQPERLTADAFLGPFADLRAELGVVAAYGRILPDALLALPGLGMINVHASLLPAWRGASPVHRAVMAGDSATGVTIMRVVKELDAGPMLARASRGIGPDETSADVERDLAGIGASLLPPTLDALEAGTAAEEAQDHSRATYAPRLRKEDGILDWTLPAAALHNHVRGLHPWPLASAWIQGGRVLVLATRPLDTAAAADAAPGTILEARTRLVVATGRGAVEILHVQPEGKRVMSGRDFLAGRRLPEGERFVGRPPA